jgi:hypothetical protein
MYAAARDLPAGTSLEDGDLVVIRARLPATALRHYLRPSIDRPVSGRILTARVRRETLIPAVLVLASSRDADLVELPVQVDPGDMAQGLRPGDSVQVLAAYTEGARRGRAVVLLPSAEVIQVFQDPPGSPARGRIAASSSACRATVPRSWPPPSPRADLRGQDSRFRQRRGRRRAAGAGWRWRPRCPGPTPRSRTPSRRASRGRVPRGRVPRGRAPRSPIPRRRVQVPPRPAGPSPAAANRPRPPPPTPATPR